MDQITGEVVAKVQISGEVIAKDSIAGEIAMSLPKPDYEGDYEITPDKNDTTLATKSKNMKKDVTVKGVPAFEVSNEWGTTFVIG